MSLSNSYYLIVKKTFTLCLNTQHGVGLGKNFSLTGKLCKDNENTYLCPQSRTCTTDHGNFVACTKFTWTVSQALVWYENVLDLNDRKGVGGLGFQSAAFKNCSLFWKNVLNATCYFEFYIENNFRNPHQINVPHSWFKCYNTSWGKRFRRTMFSLH